MSQTVLYSIHADPAAGLPLFNSATPPTQQQAAATQEIIVLVGLALADTQALLTHNFQLNATQYSFFAEPMVVGPIWVNGPVGGGTSEPFLSFSFGPNQIWVNKLGVAGTDGTFQLYLRRANGPWR